jgi:molecular chaperone DnaK
MIVGIDLGTSTSEVAYLKNGKPILIREVAGSIHGILPSVVAIDTDGQLKVGTTAESLLVPKPDRAVAEVKRKMGTEERVRLGAEEFTPQEISARILRHLKQEAEKYLGEPVEEAVITVPAYFTDRQRRATRDAAEIAGLRCRRLINEPTAAALAYGIERPGVEEKVLVYDLGGGTLDVTLLELSEGYLDVLASTGNNELGGKDFDERLMELLRRECMRKTGTDLYASLNNRGKLKRAAKKAKEELSSAATAEVMLEYIGMSSEGEGIHFEHRVSRQEFEAVIRDLVNSTRAQMDEVLSEKGVRPEEIDTALMIGGSTRVPLVREFVSRYFGGKALRSEVSADEAVALGAAVLSGIESQQIDPEDVVITDVSPHTFGVATLAHIDGESISGVFSPIIEKNQTIPRTEKKTYLTAADFQRMLRVEVYQGDDRLCENNEPVAKFQLELENPRPAGQPVEIEMSYNLDGMIELAVHDGSGKVSRFKVQPDAEIMSGEEKRRARTRLDAQAAPAGGAAEPHKAHPSPGSPTQAWQDSPLYPKVVALIKHAETRAAGLQGPNKVRVNQLLNELKVRLAARDEAGVSAKEQELIDVLFELD